MFSKTLFSVLKAGNGVNDAPMVGTPSVFKSPSQLVAQAVCHSNVIQANPYISQPLWLVTICHTVVVQQHWIDFSPRCLLGPE